MDDFPFYNKLMDHTTQLFLSIIVLAIIYYDSTPGLTMGLVLLLIYYEIYKKIILHDMSQKETGKSQTMQHFQEMRSEYMPIQQVNYISDAHLLAAQNNIFDVNNFETEIKGGCQGLQTAFDKDDVYYSFR